LIDLQDPSADMI